MKSKKCSWVSLVGAACLVVETSSSSARGGRGTRGASRNEQHSHLLGESRQLEKADTAATGSHSGEKLKRCQNWCCVADGEEHGVRFRKVLTCWKEYGGGGSQLLRMSKCRRELLLLLFLPHLIFACKKVSCRR